MSTISPQIEALRGDAETIFHAGLGAVEPAAAIRKHCRREGDHLVVGTERLDLTRYRNIYLLGGGKAAAPMAAAMENIVDGFPVQGLVNVKYHHTAATRMVKIKEAGHPVPDENGRSGSAEIMALAAGADEKDLVLCLISGGGSALLPLPVEGITLADKQEAVRVLLGCGASIHEINTIRKHISRFKGGGLARTAYPATLITLILSDVVGNDLDVIASGPTVPDRTTFDDCLVVVNRYSIMDQLPESVMHHLKEGAAGRVPETPKENDPIFQRTGNLIIADNLAAIQAAAVTASEMGYNTLVLSSRIEGETREVARVHGAIAREVSASGMPIAKPACILSGGETTVTLRGNGKGGRNQEFALAAAIDIAGEKDIVILSAGTDGTDGPTDAAGAIVDPQTVQRGTQLGADALQSLLQNDAYPYFEKTGDLLVTGPTNTNVMDLRVMLIR